MDIAIFNAGWMSFNILLALISVIFGWLAYAIKQKALKFLFLAIWIFFLPNTLYIFTDLLHFPKQFINADFILKIVLVLQYLVLEILGFASFILAILPFEKILKQTRINKKTHFITISLITLNFITGFGIVLGRIKGANSWEIFTETERIVTQSIGILSSFDLVFLTLWFGALGNLVYFLYKSFDRN